MIKLLTAIYDIEGIKDRKGQNDPKLRASEIFNKMDKNYSNSLDSTEFVNGGFDLIKIIQNNIFFNFFIIYFKGCLNDPILMRFLNPQS